MTTEEENVHQSEELHEAVVRSLKAFRQIEQELACLIGSDYQARCCDRPDDVESLLGALNDVMARLRDQCQEDADFLWEHHEDIPSLHEVLYDVELRWQRWNNEGLDYINRSKDLEPPDPPLPTPEELAKAEAERLEAYRTGGGNLVKGSKTQLEGQTPSPDDPSGS